MESTQSSQLSNCSNQKSRDDRQATRQHLLPRSPGWCESGSPSQSAQAVESFDPSKVFSIICSASKIALGSNHELMHRIWVHFTQLEIVKNDMPAQALHQQETYQHCNSNTCSNLLWYCHMCIMHCQSLPFGKAVNSQELMLIRHWRSLPWFGQGLQKLSL